MDYYLGTSKKQRPEPKPRSVDTRRRVYYSPITNNIHIVRPALIDRCRGLDFIGFL